MPNRALVFVAVAGSSYSNTRGMKKLVWTNST
jgi:hypothetical protein